MKRNRVDSKVEKKILSALIMSKEFLAQVGTVLTPDTFGPSHFKQVAEWALNYFKQYNEAPKQNIESIYHAWTEQNEPDEEVVDAVHDFLEGLSEEYEANQDINVPFLVDETSRFITQKRLSRLKDTLEYNLMRGEIADAETAIVSHKTVNLGAGAGFDMLNDDDVWDRAFAQKAEPILTFPKAAGVFLNEAMTRDALIGIQAPEKRGKTWWCVEFAIRALRNRKKIALFEVGDMSESQILMRMGARLAGMPIRKKDCGTIRIPKSMETVREEDSGSKKAQIDYKIKECSRPVSNLRVKKARRRFRRMLRLPRNKPYIMTSIHSNSSINVQGIKGILERWYVEEDFVPDVIIIDYADILAPEDARKQARDQVNDTWKALRRLSQEYHCLVIVPTQADAQAYDSDIQSLKNFTEDKRKYGHVTGMLGLNQTSEEKTDGVMRLNWIVLRESEFTDKWCLFVGQCLSLGRALCCSAL